MPKLVKRRLIGVNVEGRSGFSGGVFKTHRWIKPEEYKTYKKEARKLTKQGRTTKVKKSGRTKTRSYVRFGK